MILPVVTAQAQIAVPIFCTICMYPQFLVVFCYLRLHNVHDRRTFTCMFYYCVTDIIIMLFRRYSILYFQQVDMTHPNPKLLFNYYPMHRYNYLSIF